MCDVTYIILTIYQWISEKDQCRNKGNKSRREKSEAAVVRRRLVLLAESAKDLQKMLDIVTQYSRQWRFRVNPKKGKSEVMLFGRKPRNKDRKWKLAGVEIGETSMYKYLGIELRSGLNFAHYKAKIVAEARKRMMLVWAMGMSEGALGVSDCVRAWQALVRPVLEYGEMRNGSRQSECRERWRR